MSNNDQSNQTPVNDIQIQYDQPWTAVRGDSTGDNNFIAKTFGIKFMHYMCVPDPLLQNSPGDVRHSFGYDDGNQQFVESDRFHRENGFIYVKQQIIMGIFQGNTKDMRNLIAGLYGDSGANISLNRYYQDTNQKINVSENDKLVPCELPEEFHTVDYQKFTHNPTGIDRMQFKVCDVVFLIDSKGVQYHQGQDFNVVNGAIQWIDGGDRPGLDPKTGKGRTCAVRYTYKPYYYIKTVLHDIRIRPSMDPDTGEVTPKAGPVLVNVMADWIFLERRNADDKDAASQLDDDSGENTGPR